VLDVTSLRDQRLRHDFLVSDDDDTTELSAIRKLPSVSEKSP